MKNLLLLFLMLGSFHCFAYDQEMDFTEEDLLSEEQSPSPEYASRSVPETPPMPEMERQEESPLSDDNEWNNGEEMPIEEVSEY